MILALTTYLIVNKIYSFFTYIFTYFIYLPAEVFFPDLLSHSSLYLYVKNLPKVDDSTLIMITLTQIMMRAVQINQPGGPENLYIGQVPIPTPGSKEVLIQVKATAINRADTLQVRK